MKYGLFLVCLFPVALLAQRFTAGDLRQLKTMATGHFQTIANDKAGWSASPSKLQMNPIWPKRKDGVWIFAQRTDSGRTAQYQVWHFYQQDDTTMVAQFLDFKDSTKAAGMAADLSKQSTLAFFQLVPLRGCEIYLAKNKSVYTGTSSGQECFVRQPGAEYLSLSLSLSIAGIDWTQQAFDKDGQLAQYPGNGTWHFRKQKTH